MATPFIMPKVEMAQEAATVLQWLKREGEHVEKGEPVLVVETDKVSLDVEAPASGILAGIRVKPQEQVPVTEVIAYILEPGEPLPAGPSLAAKVTPSESGLSRGTVAGLATQHSAMEHRTELDAARGAGPNGRIPRPNAQATPAAGQTPPGGLRATPAARRLARERGIDLAAVSPSGPRQRVQAADVLASRPIASPPAVTAEVIPLVGVRRTIAERMTRSYQTVPHTTFTVRVDTGAFEEVRARLNAGVEAAGGRRISVTAFLVRAVGWALEHHPWLNSTLANDEVRLLREINVGVAVALPEGLIVPVVHGADHKGVAEIAVELDDLTTRAREGRLLPADVAGGTFTVSNLGPFGIEQFTAIINPPQAAILAVGAIQREIVAGEGDRILVRPVMRLTLSADHRIVDGAVAASFLSDLRRVLEEPILLLS